MLRIFGHYISKYYLVLSILEFFILLAAFLMGCYLRLENFIPLFQTTTMGAISVLLSCYLFALSVSVPMASLGLYQRGLAFGVGILLRLFLSLIISVIVISLLFYTFPNLYFGRGIIAFSLAFSFVGILIIRAMFYSVISKDMLNNQILVLGTGRCALNLQELEQKRSGFFKINKFIQMNASEVLIKDVNILPLSEDNIRKVVRENHIDEIVIALNEKRNIKMPMDALLDCRLAGIQIIDALTFLEKETARILVDQVTPTWFVFSAGFKNTFALKKGKRLLDFIASSILLTVASPFFILVPIALWIESRGKADTFYSQQRVGLDNRVFRIYKFRSMFADAEKDGAQWAKKNDARITRVGKWIRKARIDELPQLWNVFKGDMSMVGPRPERPEFIKDLENELPFYNVRHTVKPGLTGWAQLRYQYGTSVSDAKAKLEYDLYYVKNISLFLDLVIMLETVEVVLMGKGAH